MAIFWLREDAARRRVGVDGGGSVIIIGGKRQPVAVAGILSRHLIIIARTGNPEFVRQGIGVKYQLPTSLLTPWRQLMPTLSGSGTALRPRSRCRCRTPYPSILL